jgi:hypothetical protein
MRILRLDRADMTGLAEIFMYGIACVVAGIYIGLLLGDYR